MSEDPMRAKARATFGKGFMDAAKPKPPAKNAAVAAQKVANSRPIPTYKDGGSVTAERVAARMAAGNYAGGGKIQTSADTARKLATEMGGMTPVKKAVGGTGKTRKGMAPIKRAEGGSVRKRDTMPREPISTRPTTPDGRRITIDELNASNKPEPAPKPKPPKKPEMRAKGGAAKVRKGMMTPEGNIKQAVKPKKGIGGYM